LLWIAGVVAGARSRIRRRGHLRMVKTVRKLQWLLLVRWIFYSFPGAVVIESFR